MTWYDEHIEYGDDILRPRIKAVNWEVHKAMSLIDDGMLPQEVVQRYYDLHDFLDEIEEGDVEIEINVDSTSEFTPPVLTIEHVEAAIDFTRDNRNLIDSIQNEQEQLTDIMLGPPDEVHDAIQNTEFEYFEVNSTLTYENGTPIVDFDYKQ